MMSRCHGSKISKWHKPTRHLKSQGRPAGVGGSGISVYLKKIRQNAQKYPKLYPGILYTWNSKKVIYQIPMFKLQYTVYPI